MVGPGARRLHTRTRDSSPAARNDRAGRLGMTGWCGALRCHSERSVAERGISGPNQQEATPWWALDRGILHARTGDASLCGFTVSVVSGS